MAGHLFDVGPPTCLVALRGHTLVSCARSKPTRRQSAIEGTKFVLEEEGEPKDLDAFLILPEPTIERTFSQKEKVFSMSAWPLC